MKTEGNHTIRLAFHFGPEVEVRSSHDGHLKLSWAAQDGGLATATMRLPDTLQWSLATGESDPVLGWYSPRFGEKQPSTSAVGVGLCRGRDELESVLQFHV